MRSSRLLSFCALAMLLMGIVGVASTAHAQMASGGFTLANKTHWNKYDLPAGDYTFFLASASGSASVAVRNNSGAIVAVIPAQKLSCINSSVGTQLVLTQKGSETIITSLQVGELGLTLNYAEPEIAQETRQGGAAVMLTKAIPIRLH